MMKMESILIWMETLRAVPTMKVNKFKILLSMLNCLLHLFEIVGWNNDDDRLLVEKIKTCLKENDKASYKTRLKQVDWKQIAFRKYSAKECEDRFHAHLRRVRRSRNLNEIVVDIETNIKKARSVEGLSAYHVFVQEQLTKATTSADFVSFILHCFGVTPKILLIAFVLIFK